MNKSLKIGIIAEIILLVLILLSKFDINFGRCINDFGDGKLYNGEPFYNYICYGDIAQQNDIVLTLSVSDNNGDWLERWDWIVLKNVQ